jgi:hypothetical protein
LTKTYERRRFVEDKKGECLMSGWDVFELAVALVLGALIGFVVVTLNTTLSVAALVVFVLTAGFGFLGFLGLMGSKHVAGLFFLFGLGGLVVFYGTAHMLEQSMIPG